MSMMIRGAYWFIVIDKVTEEERRHLDDAITAEAFRPHNIIIDERKLSPDLLAKVNTILGIKPEISAGNSGDI